MQGHEDVAIFWDYENCPAPSAVSGYDVVNSIRSVAHTFGSVKLFKAYLELSEQSTSTKCLSLRSELQSSGVSLTDCPHNGRKNVADQMIIVDMLTYATDKSAPATIILISGDRDFAYAASILRLRQYRVVIISLPVPGAHISLKAQASVYFDWNTEIMGKVYADAILPTGAAKSRKTEIIQSPPPRTKPMVSPETPFSPPSPVTLRISQSISGEPTPSYVPPDQGRTKGDVSGTSEGRSKETYTIQPDIPPDIPPDIGRPGIFSEKGSLLDHSPQPNGVSGNIGQSSVSGEQTTIKGGSMRAATCPETRPISLPVVRTSLASVVVEAVPLPSQERIEPATSITSGDCDNRRYSDLQTGHPLSGGVSLGNHPSSIGTVDGRGPTSVNNYEEAPQSSPAYIQTFSARSHEPTAGIGLEIRHPNEVSKNIAVTPVPSPSISSVSDLSKISSPPALPDPHKLGVNVVKPIPINPMPPSNPAKTVSEPKSLPEKFKMLAEQLEKHHKNGLARPFRSKVAVELMTADKMLYKRAGVEKFGQYVALAEKAGMIQLGGREGDAWICLHPAWREGAS